MIFYSHWMDLVGKIISLAAFFALIFATGLIKIIEQITAFTPNPEFFTVLTLGGLLGGFFFGIHRPVVDVWVTRLYTRRRFGIDVTWEEAKALRRLFCLNLRTLQWKPMAHVREMPVVLRLTTLLAAAQPPQPAPKSNNNLPYEWLSREGKIMFNVIGVATAAVLFYLHTLGRGPTIQVAQWIADDRGRYSVSLAFMLAFLPFLIGEFALVMLYDRLNGKED